MIICVIFSFLLYNITCRKVGQEPDSQSNGGEGEESFVDLIFNNIKAVLKQLVPGGIMQPVLGGSLQGGHVSLDWTTSSCKLTETLREKCCELEFHAKTAVSWWSGHSQPGSTVSGRSVAGLSGQCGAR